ncbi:MAG: LPS export ABC transporter permease LptF [Candidatus Schekmanbacteria bacterium]|nr:LPS export ABC transporter permease LptF [Candidatus Schekmanbacteria bacterium]
MKIIHRYIFKELMTPFVLSLAAFTFVILINKIIRLTELIINKGVGFWTAIVLFSYILPAFLVLAIPCTVLIATQVAFGRLSSDQELTAMYAGGISFYQFFPSLLSFSTLACGLSLWLMVYAVPYANRAFNRMLYQIGSQIVQVGSALEIKERVFLDTFPDMVVYIDKIQGSAENLEGVLISNYHKTENPQVITAKSGSITSRPDSMKVIINLQNGSIHNYFTEKRYRKIDFESYEVQLDLRKMLPEAENKRQEKEMTLSELRQSIKNGRKKRLAVAPYEVELHKRLSLPFACLLLGLIGAPLGGGNMRSIGKSTGFILSMGIIFIYYLLMRFGEGLGESGAFPVLPAVWLPNLILLVFGIYLVRKAQQQSPIKALEWMSDVNEAARSVFKKWTKKLGV